VKARVTLFVTLLICCFCSSTALAKDTLSPEAQKHFEAGLAYADDPSGPKWDEAMKEFLAAYAISPTWKLKNNIGLCALNLERDGEAIENYTDYLDHGGERGLSEKHRKQIKKDIAMLTASLVRVTLEVEPAEAAITDERKTAKGELRVNRYHATGGNASLGLHPGTHKITVEAPGHVSSTWTFDADPASTHQHTFKIDTEKQPESTAAPAEPPPEKSEPPKPAGNERRNYTGAYIGLVTTGVFVATATKPGVFALQKIKKYIDTTDPADSQPVIFRPVLPTPAGPLSIGSGRRLQINLFTVKQGVLAILVGGSIAQWDRAEQLSAPVLDSIIVVE